MKKISTKRLQAILNAVSIVSSAMDSDDILQHILQQLTLLLNADAASIFLINEATHTLDMKIATNLSKEQINSIKLPLGKGLVGCAAMTGELINSKNAKKDKRFYNSIDKQTGLSTNSILTVPLKIDSKIVGAGQVLNKKNHRSFTKEDELVIIEFAKLASIVLNKALMHKEIIAKKIMESDLRVALKIQKQLLPQKDLKVGNFSFKGFYKPAKFIGGDYYDFLLLKDNQIFFTIADVTGKGVQASLIMASFRTYLYSLLETTQNLNFIANNLNKFFYKYYPEDMLITCFLGIVDTTTGIITYINCGHENPRLVRANGNIETLESNATIIGAFDFSTFESNQNTLQINDFIFFFTDGIPDSIDIHENRFSTDTLELTLKELRNDPNLILDKIYEKILQFSSGTYQVDDITCFVLNYSPNQTN